MAKNTTAQPETTGSSGSTYSTRLTQAQGELVEKASSLLGSTPSKFIRDAAVSRAASVINAHGRNAQLLRRLAAEIAEALLNPKARVTGTLEDYGTLQGVIDFDSYRHWEKENEGDDQPLTKASMLAFWERLADKGLSDEIDRVRIDRVEPISALSESSTRQALDKALKSAGSDFATMLLEEIQFRTEEGKSQFTPSVDPDTLLGD
ncbi:MAG: type II toxin -antitoxin system TacA 1-like antitoxin [Phycisphaerales bacterium]